jgi:hypothetical protein
MKQKVEVTAVLSNLASGRKVEGSDLFLSFQDVVYDGYMVYMVVARVLHPYIFRIHLSFM